MMLPIRPEQLKHTVSIQQQSATQDSYGEPVDTWTDVLTGIYAFVDPTGGNEFYAAQKINAEATYNVWLRYASGIKPSMRVVYGNKYFNIMYVQNIEERNKWIRLVCKEVI